MKSQKMIQGKVQDYSTYNNDALQRKYDDARQEKIRAKIIMLAMQMANSEGNVKK